MLTSKFIRLSGAALLLGGVLSLSNLLHPSEADPNALANPLWGPVHIAVAVAFLLVLFGLTGLYLRQIERAGALGLVGYLVAFFSTAYLVGPIFFVEGFIMPSLAQSSLAAEALAEDGPILGGPVLPLFLLGIFVFGLGLLLLGISVIRTGVLPRWAGILLAVGGPLWIIFAEPPMPYLISQVGSALTSIALIWLGYALWAPAAQTEPARVKPAPGL